MDFKEYSAVFHTQNDDILHYGIRGMRWGIRRYQNEDGSLTPLEKKKICRRGRSYKFSL